MLANLKNFFRGKIRESKKIETETFYPSDDVIGDEESAQQNIDFIIFERQHENNPKIIELTEKIYNQTDEMTRKYIKNIRIGRCGESDGATGNGENDGDFEIIIKINHFLHGEWIQENFNQMVEKRFVDTLTHELIHARNISNLVTFNSSEYQLIKKDRIAYLAWVFLDEYVACKITAEKNNCFDHDRKSSDIDAIIKIPLYDMINSDSFLSQGELSQIVKNSNFNSLHAMFYSIATRVALSEVSSDYESLIYTRQKLHETFIKECRMLLRHYHSISPLDRMQYYSFGVKLITEYLLTIDRHDRLVKNVENLV